MKLLEVNEEMMHRAVPSPEARAIKVFAEIVRRDRGSTGDASGRYKQRATQELAWIYHMADFQSPFFNTRDEERQVEVTKEIFGEEEWTPDELVLQGLQTYKKIHQTPSMKLLEAAHEAVSKLEQYLRDVDFTETTEGNKLKYSPKDLISNLEKLGKVVDGLSELRKRVEKEQQADTQNWGGVELNEFNRGE